MEGVEQILHAAVAIGRFTKVVPAVEIDCGQHVLQLRKVRILDRFKGDVDQLADVLSVALRVEVMEAGAVRKLEAETRKAAGDPRFVTVILLGSLLALVGPDVAQVLPEQEDKDVVLVVGGIDGATEGVAGIPCGLVDVGLLDGGHRVASFMGKAAASARQ